MSVTVKALALGLIISMGTTGCSSKPTVTAPIPVAVEPADFKVLEAAPGGRESWLDNPQLYATEKNMNTKDTYYFVGEAQSPDKRLACEKAQANIVDDVAKQVSTFTDSSIARAISESSQTDSNQSTVVSQVNEETTRISSQLSKVHINSIAAEKKYWERRDYSQNGGAKNIHACWVLASVAKQDVKNLINRAATLKIKSNAELKEKVEGKLTNISDDFENWQKNH